MSQGGISCSQGALGLNGLNGVRWIDARDDLQLAVWQSAAVLPFT
jgi:hypothetical protein